ncbi:hypothetical protein WR25_17825 [Diploscapter pachys]|uniref:Uncharacterized protein n=1 Tax=Diploscapter pachys TaxID=2018661 RepID=A0A2A2M634_9BILA|nr:hypothetical protein WR25_17825 [Diploscapter pachys]
MAETGTCSSGASSSWSSSAAIWMKWRAASRVLGPLPGSGCSGAPNNCTEQVSTAAVPSPSSSCAARSQLCADCRT